MACLPTTMARRTGMHTAHADPTCRRLAAAAGAALHRFGAWHPRDVGIARATAQPLIIGPAWRLRNASPAETLGRPLPGGAGGAVALHGSRGLVGRLPGAAAAVPLGPPPCDGGHRRSLRPPDRRRRHGAGGREVIHLRVSPTVLR